MRAVWILFSIATAAAQTAGTNQTGGVAGVVTDAMTHIPVKKAIVSVNPIGNMMGRNQGGQSAITDASGTFTLSNLQPGHYRLLFQQQNYPQARFGSVVKNVDVKAGETAGPVTVELIPGASISGKIVDEDGDVIQGCFIQIHPAKHPEQGAGMMGSTPSNEQGEYRAFGIAPGKYILSAQCGRQVFQPRPFSSGPDGPPSRAYPMQYYPLTADPNAAQAVELTPGSEKSGMDFQMTPMPVTQVFGKFSPGGADWHGSQLVVQLLPNNGARMNLGSSVDQAKGTFQFQRLFPGSYLLAIFSNGNEENRIGAWQKVDVTDRPLDLTIEMKRAIELSGKVEIEASSNTTNKLTPGQVQVSLFAQNPVGGTNPQTQVGDDGTFTLKGVMPAPWRLQVNMPFAFVKSAWLGSTDVTNATMDLSGGAAGALRILVSTNTATISGSAPAGQFVQAQRVDDDTPFRMMRGAQADQTGQYKLEGLAPGRYRLMALEAGTPIPEEGGQEVTVREGETVMADVKPQSTP